MSDSGPHPSLPNLQSLWDYDDPAASEFRLRRALGDAVAAGACEYAAELRTQIARTYSLRGRFDDAHAVLDDLEPQINADMPRARIRLLLERGRTLNSAGDLESARSLFLEAWNLARSEALDGLAVDAAHMIALASAPEEAIEWNRRALEVAE